RHPYSNWFSLKQQLQGELNRARAAHLEDGSESAGSGDTSAQSFSQHLRGLSKRGAQPDAGVVEPGVAQQEIAVGVREIGMVENVKEFRAELQAHGLAQMEFAPDGKVPLPGAESA